jgi:PAS domain S-box-containing protein
MFPILIFFEEKLFISKIIVKESEEKYRLISENANDLIAILNDKYEYEYVNEQAYLKFLGYSKDQLIGKNVWDHVHPEDLERMINSQQLSVSGFQARNGEDTSDLRIKHKDGTYKWIEYTGRVFINSEGNSNVIVISRDITDRKEAEKELKESEEKYRSLFENSPISLMDQDFSEMKKYIDYLKASGINDFKKYFDDKPNEVIKCMSKVKIVDVNRKALEVYKSNSKEELIFSFNQHGEDLANQMTGEAFLDNKLEVLSLIKGDTTYESEIETKTSTGDIISFFAKTSIVPGFESTWSKVIVSIVDITDRKQAEQIILEENKKLVELSNLRKDLITRISHELRTPLTSMYGASQILLHSNKEDSIERIFPYIEIAHHGSNRLKELVENLLDSSSLSDSKLRLRLSNENINTIILDCIKELNYLVENRQQTLNVSLPKEVNFNIDKHRFSQVIINILSNALKNTPPNGIISVNLIETTEAIDIIFKDTGVGLTQEEKGKLFQKFGKIERYGMNLDVDIEGAGLGLYISKEIVELHGGQILVKSEGRNKGSTFTIRLIKKIDKNQGR